MAPSIPSAGRGLFLASMVVVAAASLWLARPAAGRETARPNDQPTATWTSLFPPSVGGLRRCDEFDATVEGWGLTDMAAFELELGFDSAVLDFTSASVAPWLADRWAAYTELPPVVSDGNVLFAASVEPGSGSAGGDGEIAVLRFRAIGAGTSPLDLHDVRLVSTLGAVDDVTSTDAVAIVLNEDGSGCVPTPTYTPEPPPTTPGPSPTAGSATPTGSAEPSPTVTRTATATQSTLPPSATPTAAGSGSPTPSAAPPTVTRESPRACPRRRLSTAACTSRPCGPRGPVDACRQATADTDCGVIGPDLAWH